MLCERVGKVRFCTWSGFIDMDFPSAIRKVHGHQCANGSCANNGDATSLVFFGHVDFDCCLRGEKWVYGEMEGEREL